MPSRSSSAQASSSASSQAAACTPDAGEAPPAQDGWPGGLPALRAELDRIDNQIQALLIERAKVVEFVARSGKPAAFRPGREAAMLRRLLAQHSGRLPPLTLIRMWREMLAGTTAMQGRFAVSVAGGGTGGDLAQLAREHLGALTPLRAEPSTAQALSQLRAGTVPVAVLPLPAQDAEPWWTTLLEPTRLHIIARLPFWADRPEGASTAQALMVATSAPDASGADRGYLLLRLPAEASSQTISDALTAAGFAVKSLIIHNDAGDRQALAEVDGMVGEDDPRLAAVNRDLGSPVVLGGYAIPVGAST
jgi:chorismate mutase / prephenate dehydratase